MYVLHIRGEWGYIYFGYNVIVCKFCGFFLKPLDVKSERRPFVLVCVDICVGVCRYWQCPFYLICACFLFLQVY